jgi:hypothetical protein
MSNIVSLDQHIGRVRSGDSIFSRFLAFIGQGLDACARIAIRNGDQPYFGL